MCDLPYRALSDITSGRKVWKIVKIQTVFLPRRQTFKTFKNEKQISSIFLKKFCLFTFFEKEISNWWISVKFCYLVCKMFKNVSPDLVWSSRTCLANLGVQSCPVRKFICSVRLRPTPLDFQIFRLPWIIVGSRLPSHVWSHKRWPR